MLHAVAERRYGELLKEVSTEEIRVRAPQEGLWPARLANAVLPGTLAVLRFTMGWIFVYAGFEKLLDSGWTSAGFLANVTKGPLGGWFQGLAANSAAIDIIDPLVVWGEILIGLALVFGIGTRFAAFWGAAMMFMFYLAQFPPAHNPFMEYYLVYILVLGALGALGAGRILGLDNLIERLPLVRRIPGATFFLG